MLTERASALRRNNVRVSGQGTHTLMFAHGFGCDQAMWRFVAPCFEDEFRVVLFDHVGAGASDTLAYDVRKYSRLEGYADDALEICRALDLERVVFVGHSVSAMIGVLAAIKAPALMAAMVLIGPSPRYSDDGDYKGGFSSEEIAGLLDTLDANYLGWSSAMAPVIMGNPDRPGLAGELENSFCRTDPQIARHFARVTFLSDNRCDLARVAVPCLILQCSNDVIAPTFVGEYVHRQITGSELVLLATTGHCPNLSGPEETVAAMRPFLQRQRDRA